MEHETVRLIADALADATHGVGAVLALVPRSPGDALPATPPIYDETRHDFAALEEMPSELPAGVEFPCLVVTLGSGKSLYDPARAQPSKLAAAQAEFEATVNVHYFTQDSSAAAARRAARYVLRAVRGALWTFWHPALSAGRELNKVRLESLIGLEMISMLQPIEHVTIAGACAVHVRGRELTTSYTPA